MAAKTGSLTPISPQSSLSPSKLGSATRRTTLRFNLIGDRGCDNRHAGYHKHDARGRFAANSAQPARWWTFSELARVTNILLAARNRCENLKTPGYDNYGGRGITFFAEWRGWRGAERFLAHIGPRPSDQHMLDRVNNDGHYEPGNVRWATRSEQNLNRRGYGALRHDKTLKRNGDA